MKATDIFSPRVFLCKASRFLQNLHGDHLDPDYDYGAPPERDTFGSDDFTRSCDPNDFERCYFTMLYWIRASLAFRWMDQMGIYLSTGNGLRP